MDRLIQVYAKKALKLSSKKLTWRFTVNPSSRKMRSLWFILYKVNNRIVQYDLSSSRSDGVPSRSLTPDRRTRARIGAS